jgi:hypothetical protein
MRVTIADTLYLLLSTPEDGDVPTLEYPRVKNCLQAAVMWELERAGSIVVGPTNVTRGPVSPCPLGPDFEQMLTSLARPEPQAHRWFMMRADSEHGLLSEFFARRLLAQGDVESRKVSHLLFMEKTIYPHLPQGAHKVAELRPLLASALTALAGSALQVDARWEHVIMTAFYLDAFRLLPKVMGGAAQDHCSTSRRSLEILSERGVLNPNLARAVYRFSFDVQELGDVAGLGFGVLDWLLLSGSGGR